MDQLLLILSKIGYIMLLFMAGMVAKHSGHLSDKTEEDLGNLVNKLFWPALILYSISTRLDASDIAANWLLPVAGLFTGLLGLGIGLVHAKAHHYQGDSKKIFLFHSTINNFGFMVLPLALAFLPEKGAGLLFMNNLAFIILIWTVGIVILEGRRPIREMLGYLLSPALIVTVLAIVIALAGVAKHTPRLLLDAAETLGAPTVPLGIMLAGARIYTLGFRAMKFNAWNISLAVIRLIIVPAIMFVVAWVMKLLHCSDESILITLLVALMPTSVVAVSLAISYKVSPDLAAEGVIFTHVFSIVTVTAGIFLIQQLLLPDMLIH